jgi:pantoate--beta-alanine ligase
MKVVRSIAETRCALRQARAGGQKVALIPTMGYLHQGHLSLVELAKARADYLAVSLFVNPTQFGPQEDFPAYPRDEARDRRMLEAKKVDLFFAPTVEEVYPRESLITFEISKLADQLCGARRPGHFNGVLLVVSKLFNIIRPDFAVFGQKDLQQLLIIKQLVRDLNFEIEVIAGPTVREPDGLAMSSRNSYLNPEERRQSPSLYRALQQAKALIEQGERGAERVIAEMKRLIQAEAPLSQIDHISIVDLEALQPLGRLAGRYAIALAVFFGRTRLIDNIVLEIGADRVREIPAIA